MVSHTSFVCEVLVTKRPCKLFLEPEGTSGSLPWDPKLFQAASWSSLKKLQVGAVPELCLFGQNIEIL